MFGGPQHSHLHLPGEAGGQVWAHTGGETRCKCASRAQMPRCTPLPLLVCHLWGCSSAKRHLNIGSAHSQPCSPSDHSRSAEGLAGNAPEATVADKGCRRKMIKPARGAVRKLGDLKEGQSSELSTGNKGPGVGSSKSCINLAVDAGARDWEPRHKWMGLDV